MRRVATISVLVLVSTLAATVAAAGGGSVWEFDRYQRPGDEVESTTSVAWGASIGRPEDGPYFVYLAPIDVEYMWPGIPEEALLVGLVEVREGSFWEGEYFIGPHHAIARFEIPDVEPGRYQILHCNDPCTTTLGDIIGGWDLRIRPGPGGRAPEVIAAEVRESAKYLPLFYPDYSSTTVPEEFRSEPMSHPELASPTEPIQPHLMAGSETPPPDPTSTSTATVDHLLADDDVANPAPIPAVEEQGDESTSVLAVAVVVSVAVMVWVSLSALRRPRQQIEWNLDDLEGVSEVKSRVEVLR